MQPNQQNPYDFITNTPQKKRSSPFSGGSSQKARILQVAIFGGVLLIVGLIAFNFLSGAGKSNTVNIYKMAAAQQDIIDIAATGKTNIRSAQLASQTATINAVIVSQNNETLAQLGALGAKKPAKTIATYQDSGYKKALEDAQKNGNYDEAYTALLANRIDDYRAKLALAYPGIKNLTFKKKVAGYDQQMLLVWPKQTTN